MKTRIGQALVAACFVGGCATVYGPEPQDLSAPEHEQAARAQEAAAEAQEAQYDSAATVVSEQCQPPLPGDLSTSGLCWTTDWNPTEEHLIQAARHRRIAADHRAASKELREAEASACRGVAPDDRDISPFVHSADIVAVEPVVDDGEVEGVTVEFRKVPGLTVDSLEAVVKCHLARNAARGTIVAERSDPLMLTGLKVEVSEERRDAVAVRIEASDRSTAEEALTRARESAAL